MMQGGRWDAAPGFNVAAIAAKMPKDSKPSVQKRIRPVPGWRSQAREIAEAIIAVAATRKEFVDLQASTRSVERGRHLRRPRFTPRVLAGPGPEKPSAVRHC
jgi:hypothetical protein